MYRLKIIIDEITEHFDSTIPKLYHDNRIREIWPPRWASDLCMINAKRHDLPLPRVFLPCCQRSKTPLAERAGRKTESTTTITLLNEQTPTATSFPKYLRILVRNGQLLPPGVTFPHLHVRTPSRQILTLAINGRKNCCRTGCKHPTKTAYQSNSSSRHLTGSGDATQLAYCFDNV